MVDSDAELTLVGKKDWWLLFLKRMDIERNSTVSLRSGENSSQPRRGVRRFEARKPEICPIASHP